MYTGMYRYARRRIPQCTRACTIVLRKKMLHSVENTKDLHGQACSEVFYAIIYMYMYVRSYLLDIKLHRVCVDSVVVF